MFFTLKLKDDFCFLVAIFAQPCGVRAALLSQSDFVFTDTNGPSPLTTPSKDIP